ncbi:type II toxin-antitoxin system Phd/YefM family antitoxin [Naumannella cuiyingiana]|uniref:Prevent-host-death protein n=1 Tax=Naumannella cuiyingiana TaxID=1347891 RepID=A0A7Z0D9J1_9ACTN|nr:prevent-host-death protein [Naumannella cuiyingiana]NYI71471.1 hypothetical protein [Naumannella cuiyingiana]
MSGRRKMFQSSELSRHPAPVFDAAEDAPVEVTRRDGRPLVLMSADESDERDELLALAGQIIAITTRAGEDSLGDRFAERFDWMLALDADDRERCAGALVEASRAAFATGRAHLAVAELASWRSTAIALAEGLRATELDWLAEPLPVERP